MHVSSPLITLFSVLFTPALATHLRVTIPSSVALANPHTLPPSTTSTLTTISQSYTSSLRADNSFDFRNVSAGSYLLSVNCASHVFRPLRVDVHASGEREVEAWGTFRGNEWSNKGEVLTVTDIGVEDKIWGFEARAAGEKSYFSERQTFSPMSILKNPMIMIAGVTAIFVFGMPYLMENLDPELKAELEQRQKSSASTPAPANPLQSFDAAAWLAGSSTKKSEPAEKGVGR